MKTLSRWLVVLFFSLALLCPESIAAQKDRDRSEQKSRGKDGGRQNRPAQRQAQQRQPQRAPDRPVQRAAPDRPKPRVQQVPERRREAPSAQRPKRETSPQAVPKPAPKRVAEKAAQPSAPKRKDVSPQLQKPTRQAPAATKAQQKARLQERKAMPLPGKRPDVPAAANRQRQKAAATANAANRTRAKAAAPTFLRDPADAPRRKAVVRPGQNSRQVLRADSRLARADRPWWVENRRGARRGGQFAANRADWMNPNFRRNVNWSTRRDNWGYNPWWNRRHVRPWYGSSWSGSWSPAYYRHHYHSYWYGPYYPPGYAYYHGYPSAAEAIGWGLLGWSLGALVYDSGYHYYYNPYHARPVYLTNGDEYTYSTPVSTVAVERAPAQVTEVEKITTESETFIANSQAEFKRGNYLVALELADKAIAVSPGDGALHEYRALILFSLGKYGEAAGVLHPVIASGPGWDWSTMIALYDRQQTYTDQLQRLEDYTTKKPDEADAHFLLGYHYMVCGHLDPAAAQFERVTQLIPSDTVSKELSELTRASTNSPPKPGTQLEEKATDTEPEDRPEALPREKLLGTWVSRRENGGTVTIVFKDDGRFNWRFENRGKTKEFSGDYSINDDGRLVLDSKESQMVASVAMPQEKEMKFTLIGGPPEDPGLAFKRE